MQTQENYDTLAHPLHFLVNDVGMVFFFALAAKEVFEATLPRVNTRVIGELSVAHVAALATGAVGVALLARTGTGDNVRHDQACPHARQRQGPV